MSAYLAIADFIARAIMSPADVRALNQLALVRPGDSASTDVSPESVIGVVQVSGATLASILFTPDAPIVADDTNFATLNVYKRSAGGAATLVASATTKITGGGIGSMGGGVAYAIPISVSAVAIVDQLTLAITKSGSGVVIPSGKLVAEFTPGYVEARLAANSAWLDARLLKRYVVPFSAPYPEIVLSWLERLTTRDCYLRRGFTLGSAQDQTILDRAKDAEAEIKEAADSKDGLFDLPVNDTNHGASGVAYGGPLGYSETSPYVWTDEQRTNGISDDNQGVGS
jgi:hypothetical protein